MKEPATVPHAWVKGACSYRSIFDLAARYARYASAPPSAADALDQRSARGRWDSVKREERTDQTLINFKEHQMKEKKEKSVIRPITVSSVGVALTHAFEPVIKILDQYADGVAGHELPSRKDGLLRILTNNLCRDVYQQIYGVNTDSYKFSGVKDNWDRAQSAVQQLVSRYANNPEDMEADPNCARFYSWYQTAEAKMEMLSTLLNELTDVYHQITGETWTYVAPGTKSRTKITASEAAAQLKSISAGSKLIKAAQAA